MPSSPSTSSVQQASARPVQLKGAQEYRQTVYHDGAVSHIAESRRRPKLHRKVDSATHVYTDWVLYPTENSTMSAHDRPADAVLYQPSSGPSPRTSSLVSHVTHAKRSSNGRPKAAVILETSEPIEARTHKIKSSMQTSAGPTPPLTPRLARLPTPDLSDLDEAPFCDCGIEAHVVKFCKSCNKELNPQAI